MEKDFDNKEEVEALEDALVDDQEQPNDTEELIAEADSFESMDLHASDESAASDSSESDENTEEVTTQEDAESMQASEQDSDVESANADEQTNENSEHIDSSELASFETAEIEDEEFIEDDLVMSIVESILFATDKPQTVNTIKQAFQGTNVKTKNIKRALENLMIDYASAQRGFTLEEVSGGYQLRTKVDNMEFLKRMLKPKAFKLSGPALEVLSIVAYKQPCIKMNIDEIRGVESGHLLRALMEKGLVSFAGKSELPGKPMLYQTTRKFLEVFGLRNINELPSLSEIDELIPEGIGDEEEEKPQLNEITDELSNDAKQSYSEHEDELEKITDKLSQISTSSEFFEQEKARQKQKRDAERAQDIEDKLALDEDVEKKDIKWLERYKKAQEELALEQQKQDESAESESSDDESSAQAMTEDIDQALQADSAAESSSESEEATTSADDSISAEVNQSQDEHFELSHVDNPDSDELESAETQELSETQAHQEDDLISELEKAIASGDQAESGQQIQNLLDDSEEIESEDDKDLNL